MCGLNIQVRLIVEGFFDLVTQTTAHGGQGRESPLLDAGYRAYCWYKVVHTVSSV